MEDRVDDVPRDRRVEPSRRRKRRRKRGRTARAACTAAIVLGTSVAGALVACVSTLDPGEVGTVRYGGRVLGPAPLLLLPPVADPSGNVYVLYGAPTLPQVQAFVGKSAGGWSSGCNLTQGDNYGAHGWSGFDTEREWYWSGNALVAVSGVDGTCHAVLSTDPATNTELQFTAVLPWVRNRSLLATTGLTGTAESTTLVALVQAPTDSLPYTAVVDLNTEILTNVSQSSAPAGSAVQVIGVGGDRDQELGVMLLQYASASSTTIEADFLDGDAAVVARVPLSGDPFSAYAIQGYLQFADSGLVAGLAAGSDGQAPSLVVFDQQSGAVLPITTLTPSGVHVWDGQLWLVGTDQSQPVIAPIGNQGLGAVIPWNASVDVANAVSGTLTVRDDRSLPSRQTTWTGVTTAIGPFPFLSAHALTRQADGTTLWLFAGPSQTAAGVTETAFGMASVGISYP